MCPPGSRRPATRSDWAGRRHGPCIRLPVGPIPQTRRRDTYGSASDVEGLPEGQPRQHSDPGLPGDGLRGIGQLQPAPRRVPDPHPAEEVVPEVRARGAQRRARQGLRVREGALRRRLRGGHREGPAGVDPRHQPAAVRRARRARSHLLRAALLPGPGHAGRGRRVRGHPRGHGRQGRHRQGRALRPRIPRRRRGRARRAW